MTRVILPLLRSRIAIALAPEVTAQFADDADEYRSRLAIHMDGLDGRIWAFDGDDKVWILEHSETGTISWGFNYPGGNPAG